jgi:hypothetical protein
MPEPRPVKKGGKPRKSKKSSSSSTPLILGLGAVGLVIAIGLGIWLLGPKGGIQAIQQQAGSIKPVFASQPATHQDHLRAVLVAQRENAKAMHSIKDKQSAQKAIPQLRSSLNKITEATNQWLSFIETHPISSDDSQRLFLERSIELSAIRKEFPYDLSFGHNVDILTELDQVSAEKQANWKADHQLGKALQASSQFAGQMSFPGPQTQVGQQSTTPTGPAGLSEPSSSEASVANSSPATLDPSVDVPIPQTDVQQKHGPKAVAIRLHGIQNKLMVQQFAQQVIFSLGPGRYESTAAESQGVFFVVVAPIENVEDFLKRIERMGQVLKYNGDDDSKKLVILNPKSTQQPSFPTPGIPNFNPQPQ